MMFQTPNKQIPLTIEAKRSEWISSVKKKKKIEGERRTERRIPKTLLSKIQRKRPGNLRNVEPIERNHTFLIKKQLSIPEFPERFVEKKEKRVLFFYFQFFHIRHQLVKNEVNSEEIRGSRVESEVQKKIEMCFFPI